MRLIDADALYKKVTKEIGFPGWNIIPHAIEEAPTIDAVPVNKIHFTDLYLDGSEAIAVFKFGNQGITLRKKYDELAPVVHGRWILKNKAYGEYECSACGGMDSNCDDYYSSHVVTEQDYCSNCGAKMDGEADV